VRDEDVAVAHVAPGKGLDEDASAVASVTWHGEQTLAPHLEGHDERRATKHDNKGSRHECAQSVLVQHDALRKRPARGLRVAAELVLHLGRHVRGEGEHEQERHGDVAEQEDDVVCD